MCSGESIPKVIEVDIAGLDIGQRIFLRDLKVPQGVELGVCVCVCVRARAAHVRVRAYLRACVCVYVRVYVKLCGCVDVYVSVECGSLTG